MIDLMPRPALPYLHRERTRHGKTVWYVHRKGSARIRIRADYGTPEFMAAYRAALEGVSVGHPRASAAKGSLAWLIARYRESAAWTQLSVATRRQRELIFDQVMAKAGNVPFRAIGKRAVQSGMDDRRSTPFAANNYLKAVRGLFGWAAAAEYIVANPAADVQFIFAKTQGHEPWTADDVARYEARWPEGTRERVWLHVLLYTGLRLGDACIVGRQHISDGVISLKTEKTGVQIDLPILPPLAATLAAGPLGDLAFISNHYGRPFVKEAFGNAFRRACIEAGVKGKSAHGLRKTLASMGAELGLTEEQLKSWFGWTTGRMSAIYTRAARRKQMANEAGTVFARTFAHGAGRAEIKRRKSKP